MNVYKATGEHKAVSPLDRRPGGFIEGGPDRCESIELMFRFLRPFPRIAHFHLNRYSTSRRCSFGNTIPFRL
jgi:hypothetical protein